MTQNPKCPLVSVIMPCYCQGRYLAAAVDSLLRQSYPAVELIVVDDGSTDDTAAVARSFGQKVRYLHQDNSGPSVARNTGIAAARGKYLLFMDADDLLHPEALRWLVDAAETNARDAKGETLCIMGVRFFERDDDLTHGILQTPPRPEAVAWHLLAYNINPPLAYLCSHSLVQAVGGFSSLRWCEEWELWTRLVFAGARPVPVYQVGGYYRQHPTSHSRNQIQMSVSRCTVLWQTLGHLRQWPEVIERLGIVPERLAGELHRLLAQEHLDVAYMFRQQGRYTAALGHYRQSLLHGRLNVAAVAGACKLMPHWLGRALRKNAVAPVGPATPAVAGIK